MVSIESTANSYFRKAEEHAELLAFLFQLTRKDIAFATAPGGKWATATATFKIEDFINMVTGRISGFVPFPAVSNYPQTFNLSNAWNPTTMVGAFLWAAGSVAGDSQWVKIGKKIALGGAIGGVFDDPIASAGQIQSVIPTSNYLPNQRNGMPVSGGPGWM